LNGKYSRGGPHCKIFFSFIKPKETRTTLYKGASKEQQKNNREAIPRWAAGLI